MSKAFAIVGRTKTGKTTFIKEELLTEFAGNTPMLIYDVNNEYKEFNSLRGLPKIEDFLNQAMKAKKHVLGFEEATIYFGHANNSETLRHILVTKRHQVNFIFLTFHSLSKLPTHILDMLDFIVLKHTNDNPKMVKQKFGAYKSIYNSYRDLKTELDNPFAYRIIDLYNEPNDGEEDDDDDDE